MATTTDLRSASTQLPATPMKQAFSVVKEVSFATYNGDDGDLFTIMNLPANCLAACVVEVETGEGAAVTIDVNTTESSAQQFLNNASINTAGNLIGDGDDGDASLIWFYITEACTVQIETNDDNTDAAVLQVRMFVIEAGVELS